MLKMLYCKNCDFQLSINVEAETTEKEINGYHLFCCEQCFNDYLEDQGIHG